MLDNPESYYSISVHPSRICAAYHSFNPSSSRNTFHKQPDQFRNNAHNNQISDTSKRKITRAIDYLLYISKPKRLNMPTHSKDYKFRLSFLTLTLSSKQVHSDQQINSILLHQFFVEMTRRWKVPAYIWRAEKQDNGNVHYHIITGCFIPWNELRNVWNRIQNKLGYVDRYRSDRKLWHRDGFKFDPTKAPRWSYNQQLKAYKEGLRSDWNNPNSTDIHSIRNVKNIGAYFVKYMTKSGTYAGMNSRLWGCSVNLSNLKGGRTVYDSSLTNEFEKLLNSKKCYKVHQQYYSVFYIDHQVVRELGCDRLISVFEKFIRERFPDCHPPSLFD
jgi:hypothetical protein